MESGKLGMWVFLATEILMFGGLFCAYSVYRANHPEVFLFAHQYLDTKWGAINTIVLLASSFTMAWGVRAAQLGQRGLLVGLLIATLMGGAGFMLIKTVEYQSKYDHSIWVGGVNGFYQTGGQLVNEDGKDHALHYLEGKHAEKYGTAAGHGEDHAEEAGHGEDSAESSEDASAIHSGVSQQSADGAQAHGETPARGGNTHAASESMAEDNMQPEKAAADHGNGSAHSQSPPEPAVSIVEVSTIVRPTPAAAGLIASLSEQDYRIPEGPRAFTTGVGAMQAAHVGSHYPEFAELATIDANATHIFFQIYFMMTGLHGIHVLIGMGLISWITYRSGGALTRGLLLPGWCVALGLYGGFVWWLLGGSAHLWIIILAGVFVAAGVVWGIVQLMKHKKARQGEFGPEYYTPVDLVGLYWHLVDLIWIFLFPLLYLIH